MSEEFDPLDEREAAAKEVADKRVVEAMDDAALVEQMRLILEDENVRDVIWRIVSKCGVFSDSMGTNFGYVGYGLGKAAIGKWLMVEINDADPQAWLSMQLKAAKAASLARKAESLRQLRKGRST